MIHGVYVISRYWAGDWVGFVGCYQDSDNASAELEELNKSVERYVDYEIEYLLIED